MEAAISLPDLFEREVVGDRVVTTGKEGSCTASYTRNGQKCTFQDPVFKYGFFAIR